MLTGVYIDENFLLDTLPECRGLVLTPAGIMYFSYFSCSVRGTLGSRIIEYV